ncbi:DUF6714 family protein [Chitinilyticum piscinae]|uniref:Uncharacterized protein n=1 Tax=Chitinilyticum piscinae TaxID=2866724 RepID=A0A8J7K1I2_9NEIS|nr:DUF6714 family protein [Chitinilyticum piscinae]MBE9608722.1 hypothetical protein [Chitinilyticum piscinae]
MRDAILAAFPVQPFPANQALITDTYDDEGTGALFARRNWDELEAAELRNTSLVFLSPAAFAYYLPALLLAALEYPDSNLAGNLCQYLAPPKGDRHRPSFAAWWDRLSAEQQSVLVNFSKGNSIW